MSESKLKHIFNLSLKDKAFNGNVIKNCLYIWLPQLLLIN